MEDYNYSYYCSLILRDVKGLEELILTLQKDVDGLIKKKEGHESVSFLLPLLVKGVEIASLIPSVQEQLLRRGDNFVVNIKKENLEEDDGCSNGDDEEWTLEPDIEGFVSIPQCTATPSGSTRRDLPPSLIQSDADKKINKRKKSISRNWKKNRTMCTFNSQLEEKFAGVIVQSQKEGATKSHVTCLVCSKHFSIGNSGSSQILKHLKTMKHKKTLRKMKDEGTLRNGGEITEYASIVPTSDKEDNAKNPHGHDTRLVKVKGEEEEEDRVSTILGDDTDSNFYYENQHDEDCVIDGITNFNNRRDDDDHDNDWIPSPEENVDDEDSSENYEGDEECEKKINTTLSKKPKTSEERKTRNAKQKFRNRNINCARIKCSFNSNLQQKFRGVIVHSRKEDATNSDVTCLICEAHVSIANGGKYQILAHLKSQKHYKNLKRKEEEGSLNKDQIEVSERFSYEKADPTAVPVPILTVIKEVVEQQKTKTAEWEATNENHREYICPQCPEEDKWDHKKQILLNQHIRCSHPSPYFRHEVIEEEEITAVRQYFVSLEKPPFTCPICKLDYEKKLGLDTHLEKSHYVKQEKKRILLHCTVCRKTFGTNTRLKLHLQIHGPRPYSCSQCDRKYPTQRTLGLHIKLAHGERSFLCSQCGFAFPNKRKLEDHVMGAHQKLKRFKCNQCPEAYPWLKSLRIHQQRVHEGVKFLCNLCGMLFTRKGSLTKHIRGVHENLRPFSCTICHKSYKTSDALVFHMKSHQPKANHNLNEAYKAGDHLFSDILQS